MNGKIWRYLDFTKFVDMLDTGTLFFTRADKFHDKFEGLYPQFNTKNRPDIFKDTPELPEQFYSGVAPKMRRYVALNCWHQNAYESAAMWKLYLKSDEGIAIQSTYSRLEDSFLPQRDDIYCGVVNYIDYEKEWIPEGCLQYPFLHKRKSFIHEQELRCMILKFPPATPAITPAEPGILDFQTETISEGIKVPVDLSRLISLIYVAPSSPCWFTELVKSVALRYGIDVPVKDSSIDDSPIY